MPTTPGCQPTSRAHERNAALGWNDTRGPWQNSARRPSLVKRARPYCQNGTRRTEAPGSARDARCREDLLLADALLQSLQAYGRKEVAWEPGSTTGVSPPFGLLR